MAPIPHRIILLKEINEKVTQRSLLSIILSAYIYEQHSLSGSKSQKVITHPLLHWSYVSGQMINMIDIMTIHYDLYPKLPEHDYL